MTPCVEGEHRFGAGYARRWHHGEMVLAHRLAWEEVHGPIPAGQELHHDCENKACVNVEHLRLVTRSEHMRLHRHTATCKNGLHAMDDENIYWDYRGKRLCRACLYEGLKRHRRKKR